MWEGGFIRESGGESPPLESRGKAPVGGLRIGQVPQKLVIFCNTIMPSGIKQNSIFQPSITFRGGSISK